MRELFLHVAHYGLPLVFLNVFLEQIGLPIPAIPTLVAAGALAAEGKLSGWALIGLSLAASLLADSIWFLLGRRHGYRILKTVCSISLSPDSCVRQTEATFEKRGIKSLLFAKFIPGFSMVAPPLAGAVGAGFASFALYDAGGALLWAGSGLLAGRVFHRAIDRVALFLEGLGFWTLLLAVLALLFYISWKWYERQRFYKFLRMSRITPADVRALMDGGHQPVVVDVRTRASAERDPRRIPGAIQITIEEIDQRVSELPPDRDIVLYCT